jgi:hypothetical protein
MKRRRGAMGIAGIFKFFSNPSHAPASLRTSRDHAAPVGPPPAAPMPISPIVMSVDNRVAHCA